MSTKQVAPRICMLLDAWTPIWGGGQEHVWQLSRRLANNYSCTIDIIVPNITTSDKKKFPIIEEKLRSKIKIIRIGNPFNFPNFIGRGLFILSLFKYVSLSLYDLYHSHNYDTSLVLPIVKYLRNKKFIFTVHGVGQKVLGGGILNNTPLFKILMDSVTSFPYDYIYSAASASFSKKDLKKKNIEVIGNGVEIDEYDQVKTEKNNKIFKIIWVGRSMDPVKGLKYLKEAFEIVKGKNSQVRLEIVTNKFGKNKIKAFKSSDLFILPSLSEGLPLVLLEAMASKLPIVTTDVGDCRALVEKSGAGIVVAPGNSLVLSQAITKMIKSKRRNQMGKSGYEYVKKNYSWDNIAAKTYARYKDLVEE